MSFGNFREERQAPLEQYLNSWVEINVQEAMYVGCLQRIDQRYDCFLLQPFLARRRVSGNLPALFGIDAGCQTVYTGHSSYTLTPISMDNIKKMIKECERDFRLAVQKREREFSKIKKKRKEREQ